MTTTTELMKRTVEYLEDLKKHFDENNSCLTAADHEKICNKHNQPFSLITYAVKHGLVKRIGLGKYEMNPQYVIDDKVASRIISLKNRAARKRRAKNIKLKASIKESISNQSEIKAEKQEPKQSVIPRRKNTNFADKIGKDSKCFVMDSYGRLVDGPVQYADAMDFSVKKASMNNEKYFILEVKQVVELAWSITDLN